MKVILVANVTSFEGSLVHVINRECAYFNFSLDPDGNILLKVILNMQNEELKQNQLITL